MTKTPTSPFGFLPEAKTTDERFAFAVMTMFCNRAGASHSANHSAKDI